MGKMVKLEIELQCKRYYCSNFFKRLLRIGINQSLLELLTLKNTRIRDKKPGDGAHCICKHNYRGSYASNNRLYKRITDLLGSRDRLENFSVKKEAELKNAEI